MKGKTLAIIVIGIVAIAAIAAGVYFATQGGTGTSTPSPSPTSTPSPAPTGTATVTPTPTGTSVATASPTPSGTGGDVSSASSLAYSVSVTEGGQTQGYTYRAKNVGTSNLMMRIDYTDTSGELSIYIINGAQTKAWVYSEGEWEDVSAAYQIQYSTWNSLWQGYVNNLAGWTGGDKTYTEEGVTVRIYDISVNPSLPDALFQPS
jgi:hypothetical protein